MKQGKNPLGVSQLTQVERQSFRPCWWGVNPHIQTLLPTFVRRNQPIEYIKERLETPDGDFLDLAWSDIPESGATDPTIVIFHGLQGSIESPYAKGMLDKCRSLGWIAVLMHYRGCSGDPNRTVRQYHSGETEDASFLIKTIQKRYPAAPMAAVGYSLGGNMLLKYLGEKKEECILKAAVAVSAPFELDKSVLKLETGFSRLYHRHLMKSLIATMRAKMKVVDFSGILKITEEQLDGLKTFREFDDWITGPLHGFKNADDYYTKCGSRQFIQHISCPTLIIQAKDDPFLTEDAIPGPDELPDRVDLEVSDHGGHVGFISGGSPRRPEFWLENRIPTYLRTVLSERHASL